MDHPAVAPAIAYETARTNMVDSQVRPNKVNDPRIIASMRSLPRERFVPPGLATLAYSDSGVPLGNGRALVEPMVIARLVQLAAVRGGEAALVIGSASGYGSALLAACGAKVTALEEDASLVALARAALAGIAGITQVEGPLAAGWPAGAPYDVVFIEGAAEQIPPAIAAQLRAVTGRLVGVHAPDGMVGQAVLGEATPSGLRLQPMFDCTAPLLPPLRRVAGFVF
jgi:protein-L-isoaspartate(D-aspartate) O-methyltransferase